MKISPQEVAKVAKLARLSFAPEELERFAAQIGDILSYMDTLNSLDTSNVEPLYSPSGLSGVTRADEAKKTATREEILAGAPASDGEFFLVPRIV